MARTRRVRHAQRGCVYNDIVDRDLDVRVERTRLRPLASGRVSLRSAWMLIALLCAVGFVVLLQLNCVAASIALVSVIPSRPIHS